MFNKIFNITSKVGGFLLGLILVLFVVSNNLYITSGLSILLTVTFLAILIKRVYKDESINFGTGVDLYFLVFLAIFILSSFLGFDFRQSIYGDSSSFQCTLVSWLGLFSAYGIIKSKPELLKSYFKLRSILGFSLLITLILYFFPIISPISSSGFDILLVLNFLMTINYIKESKTKTGKILNWALAIFIFLLALIKGGFALLILNASLFIFILSLLIFKVKDVSNKFLGVLTVSMGVATLGLFIPLNRIIGKIFPEDLYLTILQSLEVLKGVLKESPLFGYGSSNFVEAFYRFKPLSFNLTDYWGYGFAQSSSFFLEILTGLGVIGLISLVIPIVILLKTTYTEIKKNDFEFFPVLLYVMSLVIVVSSFFVNFSLGVILILLVLLGFSKTEVVKISPRFKSLFIYGISILFIIPIFYFSLNIYSKLVINYSIINLSKNELTQENIDRSLEVLSNSKALEPDYLNFLIVLSNHSEDSQINHDYLHQIINGVLTNTLNSNKVGVLNRVYEIMISMDDTLGELSKSVPLVHQKLKLLDPQNPLYYLIEAVSAFKNDSNIISSDTFPALDEALKRKPNYAEALMLYGDFYDKKGEIVKAESYYSKALILNRLNEGLLIKLLTVLEKENKLQEAESLANRYLIDNPENETLKGFLEKIKR